MLNDFESQFKEAAGIFEALQPLKPDECQARKIILAKPAPIEFIVKCFGQGLIARRTVGTLGAGGGTGKTYFLSSLAAAATGSIEMKPFTFKPGGLKVLVLYLEDPESVIHSNLWDITGGTFNPGLFLKCLPGELDPIMKLEDMNPVKSEAFQWLDDTLSQFEGLDLLIIDPKSRVYGLTENSNEHETAFVCALEYLAKKHDVTILVSHHINKEAQKDKTDTRMSSAMFRGGSGFIDGCRFAFGMRFLPKSMAKNFGIENSREYVEFDLVKSNYGPQLKAPLFFKRESNGFQIVNLWLDRLDRISSAVVQAIREKGGEYPKRDLTRGKMDLLNKEEPGSIFAIIKKLEPSFSRALDLVPALQRAIDNGRLELAPVKTGKTIREMLKITDVENLFNGGKG